MNTHYLMSECYKNAQSTRSNDNNPKNLRNCQKTK